MDQLRLAVRIDVCTTPEAEGTEHMCHYYNIVGAVAYQPKDGEGGTRRLAGPYKLGTSPSFHPHPRIGVRGMLSLHICISALDCRWCRRLVSGCFHPHPRIGVRGMPSITGMTMGQREPHERMRLVGAPGRATFANERSVLSWGQAPALQAPLPTPLDSGFRRNDELKVGMTKGCRE